jgi:hypothetical protein
VKKRAKQYLLPKTHEGNNTLAYVLSDGDVVGGYLDTRDSVVRNEMGGVSIYHNFHFLGPYNLQLHLNYDSITESFSFENAGYQKDDYDITYYNEPGFGYLSIDYQDDKILAGTFELSFFRKDTIWSGDTLYYINTLPIEEVTRGRFDVEYE